MLGSEPAWARTPSFWLELPRRVGSWKNECDPHARLGPACSARWVTLGPLHNLSGL